jgi:hypothetical protein
VKALKLMICGAMSALALSVPAQAASLWFDFGAGSSISVTENSTLCLPFSGCKLNASLQLPGSAFEVEEGTPYTFDFAKFSITPGLGGDFDADVETTLAFDLPVFNPGSAGTTGTGAYGTIFGVVSAGVLTWANPVQQFTTTDGSKFTLNFGNVGGLGFGHTAYAPLTITVDSVAAVPEPATWAIMLVGFFGAGAMVRSRRRQLLAA